MLKYFDALVQSPLQNDKMENVASSWMKISKQKDFSILLRISQ